VKRKIKQENDENKKRVKTQKKDTANLPKKRGRPKKVLVVANENAGEWFMSLN
jgi:hypothetical protein